MNDDSNRLVRLPVRNNDGSTAYDIFVGSRYVALVQPIAIVMDKEKPTMATRVVVSFGNKSEMNIINLPCEEVAALLGKEST